MEHTKSDSGTTDTEIKDHNSKTDTKIEEQKLLNVAPWTASHVVQCYYSKSMGMLNESFEEKKTLVNDDAALRKFNDEINKYLKEGYQVYGSLCQNIECHSLDVHLIQTDKKCDLVMPFTEYLVVQQDSVEMFNYLVKLYSLKGYRLLQADNTKFILGGMLKQKLIFRNILVK